MSRRIWLELIPIFLTSVLIARPVAASGHTAGGDTGAVTALASQSADNSSRPVNLASVSAGSAAERAGLATGDQLLRFRLPATATAAPVEAAFLTILDPVYLETEAAARGAVELVVARSGQEMTVSLQPGNWNLKAMPGMPPETQTLYDEAKAQLQQGLLEDGLKRLRQAASLAESGGRFQEAAWLLHWAAEMALNGQRPELVADAPDKALDLGQKAGVARLETLLREWYGRIRFRLRDLPGCLEAFRLAAAIWSKHPDDRFQQARALISLGKTCQAHGQIDEADQNYKLALGLAEQGAPDNLLSADARQQCGIIAWWRSDFDAASDYFQQSLTTHRRLSPGGAQEAYDTNCLGLVAWRKGDLALAETHFRASLAIREKIDPGSIDTGTSINNLGLVCLYRGLLSEAESFFLRALRLSQQVDPGGTFEAQYLQNLGIVAEERGDLAKAEWYYDRSTSVIERLAPGSLEVANCLNNEAIVAYDQGDLEKSRQLFQRTLAIREKLAPGSLAMAHTLSNLGAVSNSLGKYRESADYHLRALAIREKTAPGGLEMAESLANLGSVTGQQGDLAGAEKYYRQSLELYRKQSAESIDVSQIYFYLGELALRQQRPAVSETCFRQALAIQQRLAPASWVEAMTLHALGRLASQQNQLEEASRYFSQAVQAVESQKGKLGGGKRTQELFATRYADFYRDWIDILVRLRRKTEAFQILERFRAQVLLRMMAERDLDFSLDAPPELVREEQRLQFECRQVQEKLASVEAARDQAQLEAQLQQWKTLKEALLLTQDKIRQASPRLARLRYPEPLDAGGAASLLGPGALLLSYCLGKHTLHCFALFEGKLEVYQAPVGRDEITRLVRAYRAQVKRPEAGVTRLTELSRQLYRWLIDPAQGLVKKSHRLVICPDGALHQLPFAALQPRAGLYLADQKPVAVILSATVLRENQNQPRPGTFAWQVAAFDNPVYPAADIETTGNLLRYTLPRGAEISPLPATAAEADGICQLFPGRYLRFTGPAATEAEAKRQGRGLRYLHFACHGLVDASAPLDSGLVLTLAPEAAGPETDGVLQVWEILETVRLDAALVALSACETGLGQEMGGEGIIGLTRAFLYAGSRSVLASLWEVADETTAVLMQQFYRQLEQGLPRDEALRRAMLALRRSPVELPARAEGSPPGRKFDATHPFYWASFFLCGDWRTSPHPDQRPE